MTPDRITVSAFLKAGDAVTASPMVTALHERLAAAGAVPGWRLQTVPA